MEAKVYSPKRNNGELKDLKEVLDEERVEEPVRDNNSQEPIDFLSALENAEDHEAKAKMIQEYIVKQADEIVKRKKSIDGPYPFFNPKDPDPKFKYSGMLYRVNAAGKVKFLEHIEQMDFEDIGGRYGHGQYELRIPDNNSNCRTRFFIDKALVKRVREEREYDDLEIFQEEEKADTPAQPQPQNNIETILLKMQEDKSKTLENLLVTVLAKDTGASGAALNQAYKDGFEAGKSAMTMALAEKDRQLNALEREKDDWKAKAEALQVELGQLPSNEEEPEPEAEQKPENKFEQFVSAIGSGIGETLLKKFNGEETKLNQPKQIEDKISKMSNEEKIKAIILGAFKDNLPAGQTAKAVQQFITGQIKTAFDMFTVDQIVPFLVKSHFPGASDKLVEYLTSIVKILKG